MGRSIHLPSSLEAIASQSSSKRAYKTSREEAVDLYDEQKKIEEELRSLAAQLEKCNATMDTPLVDAEGFPRNDIDVAQVRTIRSMVVHKRNDLGDVQAQLEKALARAFQESSEDSGAAENEEEQSENETDKPFAAVTGVHPSSPAHEAGLRRDDKILRFGSVTHANNDSINAIKPLIVENATIALVVQREPDSSVHNLTLTPRSNWGGRGLLGCHIVPLDS